VGERYIDSGTEEQRGRGSGRDTKRERRRLGGGEREKGGGIEGGRRDRNIWM